MRTVIDLFGDAYDKRPPRARALPAVPATGWKQPIFANLAAAKKIAIDVETYDPELKQFGPGWARGKGFLCGVSVSTGDGFSGYFPIAHAVSAHENMNPDHVRAWLLDTVTDNRPKYGAKLSYDVGWLRWFGVRVGGLLIDVQSVEALLTQDESVALETLGHKYLRRGKESSVLYEWSSRAYGGKPTANDQAKNIWRCPPSLVGLYAESDTQLPLEIIEKQRPLLAREGLETVFRMETRLLPLLIEMKARGVRVDVERAHEVKKELHARACAELAAIRQVAGYAINPNSHPQMVEAFKKFGIPLVIDPKTKAPTFDKEALESIDHPLVERIVGWKMLEKLQSTFVQGAIIDAQVNGRVHCQFNPLKGDGKGAKTGRFSSSNPNLQNIPARDEELAPLLRGLFVPEVGDRQLVKVDYSQIEYRLFVHFARGPGADGARRKFNTDPHTDFHEWTLDLVAPVAGWDVSTKELRKHWRKPVKNINFGLLYGMGEKALCRRLGLSRAEGKILFSAYHSGVPFAKTTMELCSAYAQKHGHIETLLGRRIRFDQWAPRAYDDREMNDKGNVFALPYEAAFSRWETRGIKIQRAFCTRQRTLFFKGAPPIS